jgi:hypothetical protein
MNTFDITLCQTQPAPSSPDAYAAVTLTGYGLSIVTAALAIAADYQLGQATACGGCPDQSCLACQPRLKDARDYGRLAGHLIYATETLAAASASQPERPAPSPTRPASKEAGK